MLRIAIMKCYQQNNKQWENECFSNTAFSDALFTHPMDVGTKEI